MKNLRILTILALVALCASSAFAFDLATTAAVEVVDGVTVTQVTGINFGQVADHDGALVLESDPADPIGDASHISYDATGYTPGIFTVTSVVASVLTAAFTDTDGSDGLTLGTFQVSQDAGSTNETLTSITQAGATDTWHVGCTLTVDAATASIGVAAVAYTMAVTMN